MRKNRFENKVAIVTGAAQGIGRGVALGIAAEGGQVVLADRADFTQEVVDEIITAGGQAIAINPDLETYDGAKETLEATLSHYGRCDILVNNVGGTIWAKPYEHYQEDEIKKEIQRSLFPTLWCCHAVLPTMIEQQYGVIVNISSIATRSIHRIPYAAAKGGVNAITASLAFEQASNGIRVNAIAPGGTEAPPRRIPRNQAKMSQQEEVWYQAIVDQTLDSTLMKRYGTVAEQTAAVLFLASDESSYITGSVLPVGGGDLG